ncbi:uncharacterized membrane protein YgdD (TMEM256/DUF423 family) [Lutibacter oceani]|uniref:Uncharacterized membrane protein YgdD (TMEM256/DUF423 family) n=1 Tax=Lutibacter oceani TaxID=1853311 RepID=A0A3D9S3H7_9FLAO|nr:DUF423 domain-containing protein [Lutibacter oceani]REE83162.1 uncharacterized membrane protein YgdD (TMEM256/DUF423 family) [Lutibacter oceani]
MNKNLLIAAVIGALTIILGAFGAHALQEVLSVNELKSFETGVRYQMYHVIVLMFVNSFSGFNLKTKNVVTYFFLAGILFFSGSIYAITFGVNAKYIWFLTPLGGLLFILGWLKLAFSFIKKENY